METVAPANYEHDFYEWTQHQAALLREGAWADVDVVHLVEEVESMGQNHRYALESHMANIIMHLLKWCYQPQKRSNSWRNSIWNGRDEVEHLLEHNPSLVRLLDDIARTQYPRARRKASRETGLHLSSFPEECPFTLAEIVEDFCLD